ncbi:MAG: amidinotransferase [Micromonosporaceae bacterium]|nr:amidinotransferase [Micromonosporaceae bacterium]
MLIVNPRRQATKRTYLMCPPEYFAVQYEINPWMHTGTPVDAELAVKQWTGLREALSQLGHTVHTVDPHPGLPDMVYAANSAFTVDGVVYGARFRYPQRGPEAAVYRAWYEAAGWKYVTPAHTNEGEGDFAYLPGAHGGIVLAGYGFRTDEAAHAEAQEALGRPVVPLRLVDPRFYHLDTALTVLDDTTVAYFPDAFSAASRRVLRQLFPDAILADAADAEAFGLNAISDGRHVVLNAEASGMASKLAAAGYVPVPVELGELKKGGGSAKCCVAELRA